MGLHEIALYALLGLCGVWAVAGSLVIAAFAATTDDKDVRKVYLLLWVVHIAAVFALGFVLRGVN
jgi:predicted membrane protein